MRMRNGGTLAVIVVVALVASSPLRAAEPVAELPLEFEKGLPLTILRVNGSPVLFVLDSAAVGCVMDEDRAAEIGVRATDAALSSGSGGTVHVGLARGVRLALAGLEIVPDFVVLTPLKGLGFQGPVHGILGFPLFGRYVVEIDYARRRARLFDSPAYEPPPGAETVPLWMSDAPRVRGRITLASGEDLEADFQLDTGSSHVLTVAKPFVDRHHLLARTPGLVPGQTRGIGGASADMVGRIQRVTVGRHSVENPEIRFSTRDAQAPAGEGYEANLGNGFLSRLLVTFDVPRGRLILQRPETDPAPSPPGE